MTPTKPGGTYTMTTQHEPTTEGVWGAGWCFWVPSSRAFIDCRIPKMFLANCWKKIMFLYKIHWNKHNIDEETSNRLKTQCIHIDIKLVN